MEVLETSNSCWKVVLDSFSNTQFNVRRGTLILGLLPQLLYAPSWRPLPHAAKTPRVLAVSTLFVRALPSTIQHLYSLACCRIESPHARYETLINARWY